MRAAVPLILGGASAPGPWPGLAGALEGRGLPPVAADPDPAGGPPHAAGFVAAASLAAASGLAAGAAGGAAAASAPDPGAGRPGPLIIAVGEAAPLAAAVGAAQRAARRPPAGYVIADGLMPQQGAPTRAELHRAQNPAAEEPGGPEAPRGYRTEPLPLVQDWPDAPCGYLYTDPGHAPCARLAGLRGWPTVDATAAHTPDDLAEALLELVARM
ncbi:hypothetical protein [Nocardiopsis halophila]|uniref:hypothetical protein n=1 Tax=Nocardiopsis halophila TaxID=141692 RepID=UPI000347FA0C|nr:hypothetical protein [Nocardiopsis halophila]